MEPISTKALIAAQRARLAELETFGRRLREREADPFNLHIVQARLGALSDLWIEAREAHNVIVHREENEVDPYLSEIYPQLNEVRYATQDFLLNLLTALEIADASTLPDDRRSDNGSNNYNCEPSTAKLPKINLPQFSGEYEAWGEFYDRFTNLVHNAPRIADSTKLHYLKTCLTGTAAELVRDIAVTDANYVSTWEALRSKFYKPWVIITNHLKALMNTSFLKKESAEGLNSLINEAQSISRALTNLKIPSEQTNMWFVFHIIERLDPETKKAWQAKMNERERKKGADKGNVRDIAKYIPKFEELASFLEDRAHAFKMSVYESTSAKSPAVPSKSNWLPKKAHHVASTTTDKALVCPLCSGTHPLYKCQNFKTKAAHERHEDVRRMRLCFNCLGPHKQNVCQVQGRCKTCKGKHHTLIHRDSPPKSTFITSYASSSKPKTGENFASMTSGVKTFTAKVATRKSASVILATAQLNLIGPHGKCTRVRALLDQGAETSFISDSITQLLGLPRDSARVSVTGVGGAKACTARFMTRFTLQSLIDPSFKLDAEALVLPRITSQLPSQDILEFNYEGLQSLCLADPNFHIRDSIDVLLGAEIYAKLLRSGVRRIPSSSLVAQNTVLGWIISGSVPVGEPRRAEACSQAAKQVLHSTANSDLDELLQRFWTIEELPKSHSSLSLEEERCEKLFSESFSRDENGRYVVRLPLKLSPPRVAAETRRMAIGTLDYMYRSFARDKKLALLYQDFMSVYENLGHMKRVPASETENANAWYLPHHMVVQDTPEKYKLRVVFNASRQTREKQCLNDFLMPGPALQRDLVLILLNWRRYRYVFTADIIKMFRQISVAPADRDLQRILWSASPSDTPVDYRLTTVTYGTACAPYLAIRTLLQLAADEKFRFPLGAQCLEMNTYVDDTFAGADELSIALRTKQELIEISRTAGIELDKWAANHPDLLPFQESPLGEDESKSINLDESVKTLGIRWNPAHDEFRFSTLDFKSLAGVATKRSVLSNIARLFDPLGWLAPITVIAKILMQDLWILKIDWDDTLPKAIHSRWLDYCNALTSLPLLSISRWFGASMSSMTQLHGFSDASSRAYAAAVYLRLDEGNGRIRTCLLSAKTKVAPVKTKSIPNHELCGAALLTQLICHVQKLDFLKNLPIFAWSDSQIVLTWLKKHPCHWKTFVANRVLLIQTELPSAAWAHVPTKDNPADLATRGCKPVELMNSDLWRHGRLGSRNHQSIGRKK